jgi:hypothetical protein
MRTDRLNTREQFAAIVALVKAAKCPNPGKKALQKLVYLLERELGLDLGYAFKFYTYGVFSPDLAGDIDVMRSMGLLDIRYDNGSGAYQIGVGPEADDLLSWALGRSKVNIEKIQELSEKYSCLPAWKLEILSTAVFAAREEGVPPDEICGRVTELKPKFSRTDVKSVLGETTLF